MKVYRVLIAALVLCSSIAISAQKTAGFDKSHPDIQALTEEYGLNAEQVKDLIRVYEGFYEEQSQMDRLIKENQLKRQESMKSATPDERAQLNAEMDGLSKRNQMLKQYREDAFVKILNEKQLKLYKANKDTQKSESDNAPKPKENKVIQEKNELKAK